MPTVSADSVMHVILYLPASTIDKHQNEQHMTKAVILNFCLITLFQASQWKHFLYLDIFKQLM